MRERLQLHWLCWQPTPYNAYPFRSLAQDAEFDLTVHFRTPRVASHPWDSASMEEGYHSRYYRPVLGIDWRLVRLALTSRQAFFVIGGWDEPTVAATALGRIGMGAPFAIWTDTPTDHGRGPVKRRIREGWLALLFAQATYVMGTGRPALGVLQQMGCPAGKLVNLPYFVDLNVFSPSSRPSRVPVFLSSGRLVNAQKGYDLALRALALAADAAGLPRTRISYRIAGTGPDAATLRRLAAQLGLTGVDFTGWLEPSALPGFYASGDVLLSPSLVEPYSVVVLEAMASGLVVVASEATGAALDRIEPGVNGFIHRTGDVADLAGRIVPLLSDANSMTRIGQRARLTAAAWPVSMGIATVKQAARGGLGPGGQGQSPSFPHGRQAPTGDR